MPRKKTFEQVRSAFEAAGFELLAQTYNSCGEKLEFRCRKGHIGAISYDKLSRGRRCRECSEATRFLRKRTPYKEIQQLFSDVGYTLLSPSSEYIGTKFKLRFICDKGHEWQISPDKLNQGRRCRFCAGEKIASSIRLPFELVKAEFEKVGYTLLSESYSGNRQPLIYLCNKNHQQVVKFICFRNGVRCKVCSGIVVPPFDEVKAYVEDQGYELLSESLSFGYEKIKFVCPKGHQGQMIWTDFRNGHRCRKCANLAMTGRGNPRWREDLAEGQRSQNRSKDGYYSWRLQVYKKFNKTCLCCGAKDSVQAHHIQAYNSHPELRRDVDNGVTLCRSCHIAFHSEFGVGNNDRHQLNTFLTNRTGRTLCEIEKYYEASLEG